VSVVCSSRGAVPTAAVALRAVADATSGAAP